MRSVGGGLLILLLLCMGEASGQRIQGVFFPAVPNLDEALHTRACESTRWAADLAKFRTADPERDAERQLATGNPSLARSKVLRHYVASKLIDRDGRTIAAVQYIGSGGSSPAAVICHPDIPVAEVFSIADYREDATTDSQTKWCARAVLILAGDYTRRFNKRLVGDQAFPHKDLCTLEGEKHIRGIADPPPPELIPSQIPNVATAARFGLAERVAGFIAAGADLSRADMFGIDALQWAVLRDYRPVFDLLIAAKGNPDFCAALKEAAGRKRMHFIVPLIERCTANDRRQQVLIHAIHASFVVSAFGSRHISTFIETSWGKLPTSNEINVEGGSAPTVRALLDAGVVPSVSGSKQIADALLSAKMDIVRLVLDYAAAEPQRIQPWWDGLLSKAIIVWHLDLARLLLERGAHPGPDAVHFAVSQRSPDMVRFLARHGADLNSPRLPLPKVAPVKTLVDPLGRPASVRRLPGDAYARRAFDPPLFLALDPLMDLKMVALLLELGASPNVRDSSGRTPLMVAIVESRIYGRREDGASWIEWYVPPRLLAGQEDWEHRGIEPVRALLAKGADVAARDEDGLTPLHYAARSDYNVEIARILLAHDADINAQDATGKTPLDHALAGKLERMPEALIAAGARKGAP